MNQRIIDRTYHNKTLDINVGDTLTIILNENPSTGYRWKLDQVNEEIISLEDSKYTPDTKSQIGGGGNRTFSFKSVSTGMTTIGLGLMREGERDRTPTEQFQVSVQVR